jgi:aminopeptidase N
MVYQLSLPEQAGPLGFSGGQSNFTDWYPYVPPYSESDGWLVHPAANVGEHLVYESADFDVRIRVLNAPETLLIAAPAPKMVESGESVYHLEKARRFAWSASERIELLESETLGIPIQAYVFPEHSEAGKAAIQFAAEALETFSQSYGDYPYESLTIVEAQFPDGLESDALFFLNESFFAAYSGGQQNYLSFLSAHEVAHNWWFGLVGNDAALEPWLDESFSIFSELIFYEKQHPELVDWWWDFRILDFSPVGFVNSNIYEHEDIASYVQAVYFRGGLFLQDLQSQMGEDNFMDFLNAYIQAGQYSLASDDTFFDLLMPYDLEGLPELREEYFQ